MLPPTSDRIPIVSEDRGDGDVEIFRVSLKTEAARSSKMLTSCHITTRRQTSWPRLEVLLPNPIHTSPTNEIHILKLKHSWECSCAEGPEVWKHQANGNFTDADPSH